MKVGGKVVGKKKEGMIMGEARKELLRKRKKEGCWEGE